MLIDHLNIPRGTALPTVVVIRILMPNQKAILWTNMYFLIIHGERLHDFLRSVHGFRQFMALREAISPYSQKCFEATSATAVLGLDCHQLRDGIPHKELGTLLKRVL